MPVTGPTAAGVTVPATDLVYHHSRRVYFWGSLQGRNRGLSYDPELLYIGAMFHDLGPGGRPPSPLAPSSPALPPWRSAQGPTCSASPRPSSSSDCWPPGSPWPPVPPTTPGLENSSDEHRC
jgi:hypothetical protein